MSIEQHYPSHLDTVKQRFKAAMEASKCDAVVIYSGPQNMIFQDDQAYPFKTNHHFKEWLPLTAHPESFIVFEGDGKPKLFLYEPKDYWHSAPALAGDFWADRFDVVSIQDPELALQQLPKMNTLWIGPRPAFEGLAPKSVNGHNAVASLHYDRAYKTDYEVACISKANEIAIRGHVAARDAFFAGASELEIHFDYLRAVRSREADLPYDGIVALNENASILHHTLLSDQKPNEHHSFLIDAGAQKHGYASDITRTYAFDDVGFEDLIAALDQAQQALIEQIVVGQSYIELHEKIHLSVAHILKDFDVVDLSPEAMVESQITSTFLPHGLGHHLGLCVHDMGGKLANRRGDVVPQPPAHPFLRNLRQVEVGNVFTIEPGIYFIDMLLAELEKTPNRRHVNWARVEHYKKFGGIRIEDNIWISDQGAINLTRNAGLT